MLIAEYDYDMDIKVQREEAKEEGIRLGEERGIALGKEQGITLGKEQGLRLGQINSILSLLKDLGSIPDDVKDRISQEEDIDILTKWLKTAAASDSIEMFLEQM